MGVALTVTLFDFSANDFSRQFECSGFSAKAFVNRCIHGDHLGKRTGGFSGD